MEPYIDNQFQSLPISTNNTTSLLRLHSAPSAFLSSYRDGSGGDIDKGFDFINQPFPVGTHHQSAPSIPRFLSATARRGADDDLSSPTRGFQAAETKPFQISSDGYTGFESNQLSNTQYRHPAMEVPTSMGLNQSTPLGTMVSNGGGGSCLARQTSSPAGFFAHLEAQNGYNTMEAGVSGELRSGTGSRRETSGHTRLSRLKSHTDFSSSLGHLPRIPETGTELGVVSKESCSSPVGGGHRKRYRNRDDENGDGFIPFVSWSDSPSIIPENSPNHHQHQATAASNQKGGGVSSNHGHTLTHHLSLPRTAGEVAAVEKLLNFEESVVPWKIRAKRGCATHPRSIAERVRRTRISEKMKKLQELVPNMDKQINTSDMLDLAVNYIKELQDHFKVLSDSKARCRCQNAQYCA